MTLDKLIYLLEVFRSQHGGEIEVLCPVNGYDHDYPAICDGAELNRTPGKPDAVEFLLGDDWKTP